MSVPPVSVSADFNSLAIIQSPCLGNFKYLPQDVFPVIFSQVFSGEDTPVWFGRLIQVSKTFFHLLHWTVNPSPSWAWSIPFNLTHLNRAITKGCGQSVQFLLQHEEIKSQNFDPINSSRNPLRVALTTPHSKISYQLWKTGRFNPDSDLLRQALESEHPELITEFLKDRGCHDARADYPSFLDEAILNRKPKAAGALLKSRQILIDPLVSDFRRVGYALSSKLLIVIAIIAVAALAFVGITLALGAPFPLVLIGAVVLTFSGSYLASLLVSALSYSVFFTGAHLFNLARSAALIAYHHFSQKK